MGLHWLLLVVISHFQHIHVYGKFGRCNLTDFKGVKAIRPCGDDLACRGDRVSLNEGPEQKACCKILQCQANREPCCEFGKNNGHFKAPTTCQVALDSNTPNIEKQCTCTDISASCPPYKPNRLTDQTDIVRKDCGSRIQCLSSEEPCCLLGDPAPGSCKLTVDLGPMKRVEKTWTCLCADTCPPSFPDTLYEDDPEYKKCNLTLRCSPYQKLCCDLEGGRHLGFSCELTSPTDKTLDFRPCKCTLRLQDCPSNKPTTLPEGKELDACKKSCSGIEKPCCNLGLKPLGNSNGTCDLTFYNGVLKKTTKTVKCKCINNEDSCPMKLSTLPDNKEKTSCIKRVRCLPSEKLCCALEKATYLGSFCKLTSAPNQKLDYRTCNCTQNLTSCTGQTPDSLQNGVEKFDCHAKLGCSADSSPCCNFRGEEHAKPNSCKLDGVTKSCVCIPDSDSCTSLKPNKLTSKEQQEHCGNTLGCSSPDKPCCRLEDEVSGSCELTAHVAPLKKLTKIWTCICSKSCTTKFPEGLYSGPENTKCINILGCLVSEKVCCNFEGARHLGYSCELASPTDKKVDYRPCICSVKTDTCPVDRPTLPEGKELNACKKSCSDSEQPCCSLNLKPLGNHNGTCDLTFYDGALIKSTKQCKCIPSADTCPMEYSTLPDNDEKTNCTKSVGCLGFEKLCCGLENATYVGTSCVLTSTTDFLPDIRACVCALKTASCPASNPQSLLSSGERADCESKLMCDDKNEPCCNFGGGKHAKPTTCQFDGEERSCVCRPKSGKCPPSKPDRLTSKKFVDACGRVLGCSSSEEPCCQLHNAVEVPCELTAYLGPLKKVTKPFMCICASSCSLPKYPEGLYDDPEKTNCISNLGCSVSEKVCCNFEGAKHLGHSCTLTDSDDKKEDYRPCICTLKSASCPTDRPKTLYTSVESRQCGCANANEESCCYFGEGRGHFKQTKCQLQKKAGSNQAIYPRECVCASSSSACPPNTSDLSAQISRVQFDCPREIGCSRSQQACCANLPRASPGPCGLTVYLGQRKKLGKNWQCTCANKTCPPEFPDSLYDGYEEIRCGDALNCKASEKVCCNFEGATHLGKYCLLKASDNTIDYRPCICIGKSDTCPADRPSTLSEGREKRQCGCSLNVKPCCYFGDHGGHIKPITCGLQDKPEPDQPYRPTYCACENSTLCPPPTTNLVKQSSKVQTDCPSELGCLGSEQACCEMLPSAEVCKENSISDNREKCNATCQCNGLLACVLTDDFTRTKCAKYCKINHFFISKKECDKRCDCGNSEGCIYSVTNEAWLCLIKDMYVFDNLFLSELQCSRACPNTPSMPSMCIQEGKYFQCYKKKCDRFAMYYGLPTTPANEDKCNNLCKCKGNGGKCIVDTVEGKYVYLCVPGAKEPHRGYKKPTGCNFVREKGSYQKQLCDECRLKLEPNAVCLYSSDKIWRIQSKSEANVTCDYVSTHIKNDTCVHVSCQCKYGTCYKKETRGVTYYQCAEDYNKLPKTCTVGYKSSTKKGCQLNCICTEAELKAVGVSTPGTTCSYYTRTRLYTCQTCHNVIGNQHTSRPECTDSCGTCGNCEEFRYTSDFNGSKKSRYTCKPK